MPTIDDDNDDDQLVELLGEDEDPPAEATAMHVIDSDDEVDEDELTDED